MKTLPGRLQWYAMRWAWWPIVALVILGTTGDVPAEWIAWGIGGLVTLTFAWDALLGTRYTKPLAGWFPLFLELPLAALAGLITWTCAPLAKGATMPALITWRGAIVCLVVVLVADYLTTDLRRRWRVGLVAQAIGAVVVYLVIFGLEVQL